jgi:hypothetical protein
LVFPVNIKLLLRSPEKKSRVERIHAPVVGCKPTQKHFIRDRAHPALIPATQLCPDPALLPSARLVETAAAMASAAYSSPMAGPYAEIKVAAVALHPRRPARRLNSFAVLLKSHGARDARDARWEELARTETVSGDASPAFVESFEVPLRDGKSDRAELVVALFQKTARSDELRKNALLGYARFSVAKVCTRQSLAMYTSQQQTNKAFRRN